MKILDKKYNFSVSDQIIYRVLDLPKCNKTKSLIIKKAHNKDDNNDCMVLYF